MVILACNSSWEFPQLIVRDVSMINDSCGRNYPWYGSKNQVVTIQGPINKQTEHTINMRDDVSSISVGRFSIIASKSIISIYGSRFIS
ncbi:unnamed protein product [Adineta steineri]|uniref:Uncharacterized protein n=1 Tax=Adineta steineri TaxID=433720 RepID=A0A820R273_9BILA|nr:unnamed protein product [Adineta steineri]